MYYSLHRTPSKIPCLPISGVYFFIFAFSHSLNDGSWYVSRWLQMFGIVIVSCSQMYAILKFRHFHSLIKKTKVQCNFKSTIFCNVLLLLLLFRKSRDDLQQRTGKKTSLYTTGLKLCKSNKVTGFRITETSFPALETGFTFSRL